jgi:hypothetical protein
VNTTFWVAVLALMTFVAVAAVANRMSDPVLSAIVWIVRMFAKTVAVLLGVVLLFVAVFAGVQSIGGATLTQYERIIYGADCAALTSIMGSTGALQPETREAWDAGALKYRWNGRTLLAYGEVTCLHDRVVDKKQAGLGSSFEPLVWASVLGLGCLGGVLLWWGAARGQRRVPAGRIRERLAMVLVSWLVAFAVAPGLMSILHLPASAQFGVVFLVAMTMKLVYFLVRSPVSKANQPQRMAAVDPADAAQQIS